MKTETRRKRVLALREKGWTMDRIAKRFKISKGAVQYYMKTAKVGTTATEQTKTVTLMEQAEDMLAQAREYAQKATALEDQAFYLLGRDRYLTAKAPGRPATQREAE